VKKNRKTKKKGEKKKKIRKRKKFGFGSTRSMVMQDIKNRAWQQQKLLIKVYCQV